MVLGRIAIGLGLAFAATTTPALAQETAIRVAHHAILAGDLGMAERTLDAERRIFPNRPEVLLNLAAVYAESGRTLQAAQLYRIVLARPDVLMDVSADRAMQSHAIANAGLRRMRYVETAAR